MLPTGASQYFFSQSICNTGCCTLSFYIKKQDSPVHVCMWSIQKALENRAYQWFNSHIRSQSKLPGILAEGNERTDALIMVDVELLKQARMLHQQFHLSPRNLHKLLSELPMLQCKHLARSCVTVPTSCTTGAPAGDLEVYSPVQSGKWMSPIT